MMMMMIMMMMMKMMIKMMTIDDNTEFCPYNLEVTCVRLQEMACCRAKRYQPDEDVAFHI